MPFTSRMRQLEWSPREDKIDTLSNTRVFGLEGQEFAEDETLPLEPKAARPMSALARLLRDEGVPMVLAAPAAKVVSSPREQALLMLQIASEVEHAFLLQYLYAAYSLDRTSGPNVDAAADQIIEVARQEMAHFITVQNLLIALGNPVDLNRENFPSRPDLYPFPAALEPLSLDSLAKYVTAESPAPDLIPQSDQADAKDAKARALKLLPTINRVSIIYTILYWLFQDGDKAQGPLHLPADAIEELIKQYGAGFHISDNDFADSTAINNFCAIKLEWGGDASMHIDPAFPRSSALAALATIMVQGEGPAIAAGVSSHFNAFLDLYRTFPKFPTNAIKDVPVNPTMTAITDPVTSLWAQFLNIRYQILLLDIATGMSLDRSKEGALRKTVFRAWAVGGEMVQFIGPVAVALMSKKNASSGIKPVFAGPPFVLDQPVPPAACDQWKMQRDLAAKCLGIVGSLNAARLGIDEQQLLQSAVEFDRGRQPFIEQHIKDLCGN
jgi:Ferritin-like